MRARENDAAFDWTALATSDADLELRTENPHVRQSTTPIKRCRLAELARAIAPGTQRRKYNKRDYPPRFSTIFWPERSYLVALLEFLIAHGADATRVICVGAGSAAEIPWVSELFPHLRFELYEPTQTFLIDSVPGRVVL